MVLSSTHDRALVEIIDQLAGAQRELHVIYLMACSLMDVDAEAFQMMATLADGSIELAKDNIAALRNGGRDA